MTTVLVAPSGKQFSGASVDAAVKQAGLSAIGGTAYLDSTAPLDINDHFALVGAGIVSVSFATPPAAPAPAPAPASIPAPAPEAAK